MNWYYTPYLLPTLVAAGISIAVVIAALRRRTAPGAMMFALLMLAVAEWALGYALELGSTDLGSKILWSKVQYLGIVTVPVAWVAFAVQFTNNERWLTRRTRGWFFAIPSITLILVWTNEAHGLIWRETLLDITGSLPALVVNYGVWFFIHTLYSYLLLITGTILLIRLLVRYSSLYRWQVGTLLLGVMAPWLGNVVYLLGWAPLPNLDITPFAFTISGILLSWGLFRFRLLDIVPVARRAVVEMMRDAVIVLDLQNRLVDLNPAARQLVSKNSTALIGRSADQVFAEWPDLIDRYRGVAETRSEITLTQKGKIRTYELRISPIYDRAKQITGRLIIVRDMTALKKANEELQRQALTFENISDSVILTDLKGLIVDCNPATETMFGYKREEILNKSPNIWHETGKYLEVKQNIIDGIDQGGRWEGELKFTRKNGSEGVCEAVVLPLCDHHGKQIATIGVSRDITDRKAVEKALQEAKEAAEAANRAKSTFLANMSHELRTPLTVMLGYSEMLQEDAEQGVLEQVDLISDLKRIQIAGNHLLSLITDILDLSKIEAERMELVLDTFHIPTLLEEIMVTVEPLIQKNGNTLELLTPDDLGFMVADQTKVRQILFNLLSNAAKFTEQGQIKIAISQTVVNDIDWIKFEITDTGIGMTPDEVERVFQPFTQANTSTIGKFGGTGLGLAISRHFCRMMHGDITVDSEPGQGSTFIVNLPVGKIVNASPELILEPQLQG